MDTVGPDKVNFKLNYASAWAGQVITLSQGTGDYSDPTDKDKTTLKRVVSWGDGYKTTLSPTATSVKKAYGKAGKFKVTITVTDPAGNFKTSSAATVTVTLATGKVSLNKTKVYQGAPFTVKVAKVPAGTVEYRIAWSDGYVSTHKAKVKSVTERVLYPWVWDSVQKEWVRAGDNKLSGLRAIKISWKNAKGWSIYQQVGKINVLKDNWAPTLTITKPSSPNRASSWKTVKGTATDKGAGVDYVRVTAIRVTSVGNTYCLTPAKKWKLYYSEDDFYNYCYKKAFLTKVVKGKWSVKFPSGLTKNQVFLPVVWTFDDAANIASKFREIKITRS